MASWFYPCPDPCTKTCKCDHVTETCALLLGMMQGCARQNEEIDRGSIQDLESSFVSLGSSTRTEIEFYRLHPALFQVKLVWQTVEFMIEMKHNMGWLLLSVGLLFICGTQVESRRSRNNRFSQGMSTCGSFEIIFSCWNAFEVQKNWIGEGDVNFAHT